MHGYRAVWKAIGALAAVGFLCTSVFAQTLQDDDILPLVEARQDADGDYQPDRAGDTLTVAGRVSVATKVLHFERLEIYIQDGTGAIELFSMQPGAPVEVGDSIIVRGTIDQFRGLTQLNVLDYRVVDAEPRIPEPIPLTIAESQGEDYEGSLVRVQGRVINKGANQGGKYLLLNEPGQGDDHLSIYVGTDHMGGIDLDSYSIGDYLQITGLLSQYDAEAPFNDSYQLLPRSPADLVLRGFSMASYRRMGYIGGGALLVALLGLVLLRVQVKRRTLELSTTKTHFQSIYEGVQDAVLLIDLQYNILSANPATCWILGYQEEELKALRITDLLPEEAWLGHMEQAQGNGAEGFDVHIQSKAGEPLVVNVRVSDIRLGDDKRLLVVLRDITEHKQAEEALQWRSILLSRSQELAHVGHWRITLPTGDLEWSDEVYRIHGVAPDTFELNVENAINAYHPEDRDRVGKVVEEAIGQGVGFEFELRVIRPSGEVRNVLSRGECSLDAAGQVDAVFGVFMDITERKQAEEEREHFIESLEAKNAELEQFTYTVSHDLKSPLVTIRGFLGMLFKDATDGNMERLRKDMTFINEATDKMQRLLDELLELSRIGRLMNPPESIPFGELVREAVEMVSGRIVNAGATIEIAPDLPSVFGDRVRLVEALQNLIDNAVKFMGDQPHPKIEIGCKQEGEETVFYVQDNGMGIDLRYHEKIFGLFDRLDPQSEGTGIGLALVKRIIEVHEGRIWVASEGGGKGATFYFTLSLTDD